ncbi:hypothetical protein [Xanthocytophaga flava]|nr:hypothetical protein [Xanthocytophaga flavus]
MGYDIFLMPKTRDEEKAYRITLCEEKNTDLSETFTFFHSGEVGENGLKQVEAILAIDLSAFKRSPANYMLDTGELEYSLYLAEEQNDTIKIAQIKVQIEQAKVDWDKSYDTDHRGWTLLTEMRQVVQTLIQKMEEQPDFGKHIKDAEGWGDYFLVKPSQRKYGEQRLINDLQNLLATMDCMEAEGVEYVGFVGM